MQVHRRRHAFCIAPSLMAMQPNGGDLRLERRGTLDNGGQSMLKALSLAALGAFVILATPSTQAAPLPGLSLLGHQGTVQQVYWRHRRCCRCWWRWHHRHCHCWC